MEYENIDIKNAKYFVFMDYGYDGCQYHTFDDEASALEYIEKEKADEYYAPRAIFITPIVEGTELFEESGGVDE